MTTYEHRHTAIAKWTAANIAARDAYHEQRHLEDTSAAEKDRAKQARYYANRRAKKGLR